MSKFRQCLKEYIIFINLLLFGLKNDLKLSQKSDINLKIMKTLYLIVLVLILTTIGVIIFTYFREFEFFLGIYQF
jgi:hypothetical protein